MTDLPVLLERIEQRLSAKLVDIQSTLAKTANGRTRQSILQEVAEKGHLLYKDYHIQVYPDIPQDALKIQKALKSTTLRLQQADVRYRWLVSGVLQVSHRGSTLQAVDEASGLAVLESLQITELMDTSGRSGKRWHESPDSPERDTRAAPKETPH
ncbi:UNVERIFIED_CONTAM: hypothetical protein K2H54_047953 [Gekko kuhli]